MLEEIKYEQFDEEKDINYTKPQERNFVENNKFQSIPAFI